MGWLIAAVVILTLIYFMIVSPGFRMFALCAIGLLGFWAYSLYQSEQKEVTARKAQAAARHEEELRQAAYQETLIPPRELKIINPVVDRDKYLWEKWSFTGSVINSSKYRLTGIVVQLAALTCSSPQSCIVVGETTAEITFARGVPPSQARGFDTHVEFRDIPKDITPTVHFRVVRTRGVEG
jgi:hypothetical protein